ncbi:hypothetical protein DFJ74DRAFT_156241 [Hyaloraphidium curvatum]|nr:hypothetical protein DFJ74DRAFT_156241 [Hyaloraphidium curvatum]
MASRATALGPKLLVFASLVAIQVSVALVYKLSQRGGRYEFSQASALAMSELFKLGLSAVLYVSSLDRKCESVRSPASFLNELWTIVNDFRTSVSPTLLRNISLLSFSYAVNNHLAFYAFLLASPGTIQLVKSGSTFLTAFILFFILSRPISQLQWIAMAIQMLGLVQSQYNECKQTVAAPLVGYIILLVQVTMTAANGAYRSCDEDSSIVLARYQYSAIFHWLSVQQM